MNLVRWGLVALVCLVTSCADGGESKRDPDAPLADVYAEVYGLDRTCVAPALAELTADEASLIRSLIHGEPVAGGVLTPEMLDAHSTARDCPSAP